MPEWLMWALGLFCLGMSYVACWFNGYWTGQRDEARRLLKELESRRRGERSPQG